jgi:hypothetical protein
MDRPQIKLAGLYTYPNNLSEVPTGSLQQADNIVLDADGEIQSRRGFDVLVETVGMNTSIANKLFKFQGFLIAQYDADKLAYRSPGVGWINYTGSFAPVDAAAVKTRAVESNSNFYFTSSTGIRKLDAYNGAVTNAGGIKALDIQSALAGAGSGFLTNNVAISTTGTTAVGSTTITAIPSTTGIAIGNYVSGSGIQAGSTVTAITSTTVVLSQTATIAATGVVLNFYTGSAVAYRVVFGIRDANNNLILGSPSQRFVIANTGSTSDNTTVTITVPQGVTTNHLFQISRSGMTVAANIEPNDELQLVYEGNPSAGQIAALSITVTDITPDSLRGATIYTASSQEGILQANEPPPLAVDIAQYKDYVFYANTTSKYQLNLTLLAAGGTSGVGIGDTITINSVAATTVSTDGTNVLKSVASVSGIAIGQVAVGAGIPNGTTVTAVGTTTVSLSAATTITASLVPVSFNLILTAAAVENIATSSFAVVTTGTPAQNITSTANSLVRVINRSSSNGSVYAYYLSGVTDLPGKILLQSRLLGAAAFYLNASAHSTGYSPFLLPNGTSVLATQSIQKNALYCSKQQQPESVPLTNVFFVGSAAYPIKRIIPLRDSLFILKDDGIFQLVGQTLAYFYINLFDSTSKLLAPDSAVDLNNTIYCLSNQGVISISDTGISVVSRPIEGDLLSIFGANLTNVQNMTFGVSYQSDRKYLLGIISAAGDLSPTQVYVYNLFTNAWTRWPLSKTCGIVNSSDDKLYFGSATSNNINVERKNFDYSDYIDAGTANSIIAFNGTSVTLGTTTGITVGDLLYQSYTQKSVITAINIATSVVTVQNTINWTLTGATINSAINCVLSFQPQTSGQPFMAKQYSELEMFFKRATFYQASVAFTSDLSQSTDIVPLAGNGIGAWGLFPFGTVPFGGIVSQLPIRTYVPLEKQRCSQLNLKFIHRVAYGNFILNGFNLKDRSISERVSD